MEKDWRWLNGLDRNLMGKHLIRMDFVPTEENDHEHCALCWEKFGKFWQYTGYRTAEGRQIRFHRHIVVQYDWICNQCFHDFQVDFHWVVDAEQENQPAETIDK